MLDPYGGISDFFKSSKSGVLSINEVEQVVPKENALKKLALGT